MKPFHYRNLGSMATVGRNRAVAEFSKIKTQGWFAWVLWLVVHLRSILGVRNKVVVLLNWIWNYFTYDQSMRMIVYARKAKEIRDREVVEATTHLGKDLLHEPQQSGQEKAYVVLCWHTVLFLNGKRTGCRFRTPFILGYILYFSSYDSGTDLVYISSE